MGKVKKATRKFEKNHLKDTIERRKGFAKTKQRHQLNAKKKARRAADNKPASDLEDDKPTSAKHAIAKGKAKQDAEDKSLFDDMTVDQFFQADFDIPDRRKASTKKSKKTKEDSKSKKRKRDESDADDQDDDSQSSALEGIGSSDEDAGSGSEMDADFKGELDALAEKDPEFYKYLKENDAELLNFDEEDVNVSVDQSEEDEGGKKKKRKTDVEEVDEEDDEDGPEGPDGIEVTSALVQKWTTALKENHSLRATREVVQAFRSAVHVNEDDSKGFKYRVSNPDGKHALQSRPHELED
jgi:nucleolar complex protein 2